MALGEPRVEHRPPRACVAAPRWHAAWIASGDQGRRAIHEQLFIADRAVIDHARDLIDRFGGDAGVEAAERAERSRDKGNLIHFCRWRQIERLILVLTHDEAIGTVH